MDVKQWSSRDNEIISAAKRMALLMAKLSQLVRYFQRKSFFQFLQMLPSKQAILECVKLPRL